MATKLAERSETVTAIKEELWGMLEPKHLGSQAYELVKATTRLGRLAANDIVISSNKVSGTHCTIEHDAGRVFITDSSGNGTFLNHNRLPKGVRTELRHNDLIWLLHESIVQPA
jgi:pSer/pThr/pTyr-binding forkhead associated (FHA) protein